jgi:hypothetical protein
MDESEVITQDVECADCGYNLRGLAANAACPECGKPIQVSLQSFWIDEADSQWVKRLAWGHSLLLLGLCWHLVDFGWGGSGQSAQLIFYLLSWVLPTAMAAVGVLWLTRPDPTGQMRPPPRNVRWALRCGVLFIVLVEGVGAIGQAPYAPALFSSAKAAVAQFVFVIFVGILYVFYKRLAARLDEPQLGHRMRWSAALFFLGAIPSAFLAFVQLLLRGSLIGNSTHGLSPLQVLAIELDPPILYCVLPLSVVSFLGIILGVFVLFQFNGILHQQKRYASTHRRGRVIGPTQ